MENFDLFKAFKVAIENETAANTFYLNMARQIEDAELKKVIMDFAEDEYRHKEALMELYGQMKKPD